MYIVNSLIFTHPTNVLVVQTVRDQILFTLTTPLSALALSSLSQCEINHVCFEPFIDAVVHLRKCVIHSLVLCERSTNTLVLRSSVALQIVRDQH